MFLQLLCLRECEIQDTEANDMSSEETGRPPLYDSDKAALERIGKKQVLKV